MTIKVAELMLIPYDLFRGAGTYRQFPDYQQWYNMTSTNIEYVAFEGKEYAHCKTLQRQLSPNSNTR